MLLDVEFLKCTHKNSLHVYAQVYRGVIILIVVG